jgi:hypothetical protein
MRVSSSPISGGSGAGLGQQWTKERLYTTHVVRCAKAEEAFPEFIARRGRPLSRSAPGLRFFWRCFDTNRCSASAFLLAPQSLACFTRAPSTLLTSVIPQSSGHPPVVGHCKPPMTWVEERENLRRRSLAAMSNKLSRVKGYKGTPRAHPAATTSC